MRIGIDVSQAAYGKTGVANYLTNLVSELIKNDRKNEYVLFFASLRREFPISDFRFPINAKNIRIKKFKIPPTALDFFWNRLHIFPIELFIGKVDFFITSDWTEPPSRCKKATIIYDLIVYKHPDETDQKIVSVQKRRLDWVKKESDIVFCISESTRNDAVNVLGIEQSKTKVVYPGL
jgi:hypothetical protein